MANSPAIAPLGESLPNSEAFRRLAARMGFTEDCFRDSDEDICRQAIESSKPSMQGIEWESLKAKGWQRLNVPERFAPFRERRLRHPLREVRVLQRDRDRDGMDPLPMYIRHASPRSRTPRSRRSTRSPSSLRPTGIS